MEAIKIEKELKTLRADQKSLKRILAHRQEQTDLIFGEIEKDMASHGDKRRTLIETGVPASATDIVLDEPVTVTLSTHGWIRLRQGHGLDVSQFSYKTGDSPLAIIELRTIHHVAVLDMTGRLYNIRVTDIPGGRGDGVPVTTLVDFPSGVGHAQAFGIVPEGRYIVAGTGGTGFIVNAADLLVRVRAGKAFMTIESGEKPLPAEICRIGAQWVAALSDAGRLLVFEMSELKTMNKGRGLIMMDLSKGEKLISVAALTTRGVRVHGTNRSGTPVMVELSLPDLKVYRSQRAKRGTPLEYRMKPSYLEAVIV